MGIIMDHVFYKAGSLNVEAFAIKDDSGIWVCSYSGKPQNEMKAEGAELMTWDDCLEAMKEAETKQLRNPWKEIDKEEYNEMLEVLPPEKWSNGPDFSMFRMMEYYTSNWTSHYCRIRMNGEMRYFAATRQNTDKYADLTREITEQFKKTA
jgi:hypothetical protein